MYAYGFATINDCYVIFGCMQYYRLNRQEKLNGVEIFFYRQLQAYGGY